MLPPGCLLDDVPIGNTEDLHNTGELLLFVLAREDRHTSVQLGEDASNVSWVAKARPTLSSTYQ
jgi:hypothetical protein